MDEDYVYECFVDAQCITKKDESFEMTYAVCTTRKKARLYSKGYLLEQWKHKGYEFTQDKIIPYQAGHIYYVQKGIEKWILTIYVFRRQLDTLWVEDFDDEETT